MRNKASKGLLIIIILSLVGIASAQNAKVIQLSVDDASAAKALYEEKIALDKKISNFDDAIYKKYTEVLASPSIRHGNTCVYANVWPGGSSSGPCDAFKVEKEGWEHGFVYSEDFKFIVPKQVETPKDPKLNCPFTYANSSTPCVLVDRPYYAN